MKKKEFFNAWCELEKSEKNISYLYYHYEINEDDDAFSIHFIKKQVEKFHLIYPPYMFHSPEIIIKKTMCNICYQENKLRNHCGHFLGQIYNGKGCVRYIKDFEMQGIALVGKPKWKYRVIFDTDASGKEIDTHDYSVISYLIEKLPSPFVEWNYEKSKILYPHSLFSEFDEFNQCPCGSGKEYGDCCLSREGILRDHISFYGFEPLYHSKPIINESQLKHKRLIESKKDEKPITGLIFTEDSFFID